MTGGIIGQMGESPDTKMQSAQRKDIPTDVGLLPGMLVREELWKYQSLLFKDPKLWARIHLRLAVRSFQSVFRFVHPPNSQLQYTDHGDTASFISFAGSVAHDSD
jgi:hypothetical protein